MARNFFKQATNVLKQLSIGALNSVESQAARVPSPKRSVQLVEPLQQLGPNYPLWVALGGLLAYEASSLSSGSLAEPSKQSAPPTEDGLDVYRRERQRYGLPKEIILYQYEVCPFCNKVRAFLDYHNVPYRTVEVNPLTKKQLQWSEYRKVPVVLLDQEAVNDSSAILSRLAIEFEPEHSLLRSSGWFSSSNQKAAVQPDSVAEEEEIKWRLWVDKKFVQLLTVNIYRSLRESWQTFDYITQHGNFSFSERQAARAAGSGLMYFVSGKMIKKYGIEGDVREALYAAANEWVAAVGERRFMGGDSPNLADLSVFGVIRSITGTSTFTDLTHNSRIGPWYERMMGAVGESSRLPDPPASI